MIIQKYKDGYIEKTLQGKYVYILNDKKSRSFDSVAELVKESNGEQITKRKASTNKRKRSSRNKETQSETEVVEQAEVQTS